MITFMKVKNVAGTQGDPDRKWAFMVGLSSDSKPTTYANGSKFEEMDTGKGFRFNEVTESWIDSTAAKVSSFEISTPPTKVAYVEGQVMDAAGAKITLTLADETTQTVDATCPLTRPLTLEDVKVPLEGLYNGVLYSALQSIEVSARAISTIEVTKAPDKTTYGPGETLTMEGLVLKATYNDESTDSVAYGDEGITYSPAEGTEVTENTTVTITYGGKTCTQDISYEGE